MFSIALIFHEQRELGLARILQLLQAQGFAVKAHTWKGLSTSTDQIRWAVASTDVVVQCEDEDLTTDELEQLAPLLPETEKSRLKRCRGTLVILPFQPDATVEQYEEWLKTGIRGQVPRHATLDNPDVLRFAKAIGEAVQGFIFDNTENCFV